MQKVGDEIEFVTSAGTIEFLDLGSPHELMARGKSVPATEMDEATGGLERIEWQLNLALAAISFGSRQTGISSQTISRA